MTGFNEIRPVWYEGGDEKRLLFYDIFRGLFGKVWIVAPLMATNWINPESRFPTVEAATQPVPLLDREGVTGFLQDVVLGHGSTDNYAASALNPAVYVQHWHAIMLAFDVPDEVSTVKIGYVPRKHGDWRWVDVPLPQPPTRRFFCADTTMFRDDAEIMAEWLRHSRNVGFDHFFLYDNFSADGFDLTAEPDVTVLDWPYPCYYRLPSGLDHHGFYGPENHGLGSQIPQQIHALYKHGTECQWMGFLDDDEYLNLRKARSLREFLKEDGGRAAVLVPSLFFGDQPDSRRRSIRGRYRWREQPSPLNGFGYARKKPLVNVANIQPGERVGVHDFATERDGKDNMRQQPFSTDIRRQVPVEEAYLNHYWSLSIRRRGGDLGSWFLDVYDDSILAR